MTRYGLLALAGLLTINSTRAQTVRTEHVLGFDDGASSPAATLADVTWLAGAWEGEGFGGTFEEVWTPPASGSMVGLFKLIHNDAVTLYEIQTISEEEGTLVWKVKHFNADFTAWEDKDDFVRFPLVKIDSSAAYFDGLTLINDGSHLTVYLIVSSGGEHREEKLTYRPVNLRESPSTH